MSGGRDGPSTRHGDGWLAGGFLRVPGNDRTEMGLLDSRPSLPRDRSSFAAGAATLVVAASLTVISGRDGIAVGLVLLVLWYLTGPVSVYVVAHLLLALVFPSGVDPVTLSILETELLGVLVLPIGWQRDAVRRVGATLLLSLAFAGVLWVGHRGFRSTWAAGTLLVLTCLGVGYVVYRYSRVSLGQIHDEGAST